MPLVCQCKSHMSSSVGNPDLLSSPLSLIHLGITAIIIMADCSGRCYPCCCRSWEPNAIADSRAFQSYALGKQCPCQLPLLPTGFEHSVLVTTEAPGWDNYTPTHTQAPVSPRPLATITLSMNTQAIRRKGLGLCFLSSLSCYWDASLQLFHKKRDALFLRMTFKTAHWHQLAQGS